MSPRKLTKSPQPVGVNKPKVIDGGAYLQTEQHFRFDEMDGHTIYITKIEQLTSEQFGSGFKVWFKDMPNELGVMTASTFGAGPCAQLIPIFQQMQKGGSIPAGTYIKLTIRKAGRSYRFE